MCIDPETVTDDELRDMYKIGVRGVRLNMRTWGEAPNKDAFARLLLDYAKRLQPLKLVLQLYIRLSQLQLIADIIPQLGIPVVIDHLGHPEPTTPVSEQPGYGDMLSLLRAGNVWTKLSGTYRFEGLPDMDQYVRNILHAGPSQVVWASDWPHSGGTEKIPEGGSRHDHQDYRVVDDKGFVNQCIDWCDGDEGLVRKIFVENPRRLWQCEGFTGEVEG